MPIVYAESYEQRLERTLEFHDKNHKVANVIALRERPEGKHAVREQFLGANLVTDTGEIAYAEKAAGQTPTNDFWSANSRFVVRDNASALSPNEGDSYTQFTNPVAGSLSTGARESGYPKTADNDGDNSGASPRVVTWKKFWGTTDFTATNISGLVIVPITTPTTGTALLNHSVFSPVFAKANTDTLKVFVNHTFENQ